MVDHHEEIGEGGGQGVCSKCSDDQILGRGGSSVCEGGWEGGARSSDGRVGGREGGSLAGRG